MKINKLWVMVTSSEALRLVAETPHSYGNADHCLFIGPEGPTGSREVTEDLAEYLTNADWRWIYAESDRIRAEQEAIAREKIAEAQEAFLRRFDAELEIALAEEDTSGPEENASGGSAENE